MLVVPIHRRHVRCVREIRGACSFQLVSEAGAGAGAGEENIGRSFRRRRRNLQPGSLFRLIRHAEDGPLKLGILFCAPEECRRQRALRGRRSTSGGHLRRKVECWHLPLRVRVADAN